MLPSPVNIGSPWHVLPPGIHDASLDDIKAMFATNTHRKLLFQGFRLAIEALIKAGCKTIYLDGSFVTGKPKPNDYDLCWSITGVDPKKLDPVMFDFSDRRAAQKQKYRGELFPVNVTTKDGMWWLNYFQTDKHTGKRKGIIRLKTVT